MSVGEEVMAPLLLLLRGLRVLLSLLLIGWRTSVSLLPNGMRSAVFIVVVSDVSAERLFDVCNGSPAE